LGGHVCYTEGTMSKLTREDVLKLAQLAKLELTEEEQKKFLSEISEILGYVEQLQSVEVDDLEPTYQVNGLSNVSRKDEIRDYGIDRQALLKNLPAEENGQIKVKRVLG